MVSADSSPQVAVIGEALVDVLSDNTALVGGSPLNVAVGLSRLGFHATLHSRVGADDYGTLIRNLLNKESVDTPEGFVDSGRTSTATVTLDSNGVASYEFDLDWDINVPDTSRSSIIHTGSIGAVRKPGGTAASEAIRSAGPGVLRTYDPNIRADIMGEPGSVREHVYDLAASCHVVKLSDEDAAWIGEEAGTAPLDVLQRISDAGTRFAVLTTGEHGCTAIVDGRTHALPSRPVEVVDTIGAGDAFTSGLIYALSQSGLADLLIDDSTTGEIPEHLVVTALDTALASSSVAVSRSGAQPPSLDELNQLSQPDPPDPLGADPV